MIGGSFKKQGGIIIIHSDVFLPIVIPYLWDETLWKPPVTVCKQIKVVKGYCKSVGTLRFLNLYLVLFHCIRFIINYELFYIMSMLSVLEKDDTAV